jgi:Fic family protein
VVEMMLDATQQYVEPLTEERLCAWHAALFPTGRSGMAKIIVWAWRNGSTGPVRVVSGPMGRERVHFEAPVASRLEAEMSGFFTWFNEEAVLDPVLKAALAHLWFVAIHPFADGNGRIARYCRHVARALGAKRAALLPHVRANPAGAQRLLRHSGSYPERRS